MTEREQFEAWANGTGFNTTRNDNDNYLYSATRGAWEAWQAARAQSSTSNPVEVSTTVQAGRVLTDEEIQAEWVEHGLDDCAVEDFARAIEAAVLAKRVPMQLAQIEHALRAEPMADNEESFARGIRAAERHHGIVGEKGGA